MNNIKNTTPSPFTQEQLDAFRCQGDPLADEVIDAFADQYGGSIQKLAEQLQNMIRMPTDDDILVAISQVFPDDENICKALEKYFTRAVIVPDWVDAEQLKMGGDVFQDHLFTSFMVLGCASLPICYVCRPDVKVLSFTRRLIDDAPKRLVETAQMVTDVMSSGGLKIEGGHLAGKGVQSILKIRLIHASIRHLLVHKEKILAAHAHADDINHDNFLLAYVFDSLQEQCNWYGDSKPDAWNEVEDGVPINKEALAETLLTFSYLILRGLEKIGVHLNVKQQNAFLHSWNIAGYVLGVDEAFLKVFNTYPSADVIYNQIIQRRFGKTQDGILLEQSLLEVFSDNAGRLIPFGRILHVRRLARLVSSKLISEECYTALGLKLSLYDRIVRIFIWMGVRTFGWFVNHSWLRPVADYMFGRIAQSLWDWRADFSDGQTKQSHNKNGVCNPLVIPSHLIKTSHLSNR